MILKNNIHLPSFYFVLIEMILFIIACSRCGEHRQRGGAETSNGKTSEIWRDSAGIKMSLSTKNLVNP